MLTSAKRTEQPVESLRTRHVLLKAGSQSRHERRQCRGDLIVAQPELLTELLNGTAALRSTDGSRMSICPPRDRSAHPRQ
jgi:hypothetical protein